MRPPRTTGRWPAATTPGSPPRHRRRASAAAPSLGSGTPWAMCTMPRTPPIRAAQPMINRPRVAASAGGVRTSRTASATSSTGSNAAPDPTAAPADVRDALRRAAAGPPPHGGGDDDRPADQAEGGTVPTVALLELDLGHGADRAHRRADRAGDEQIETLDRPEHAPAQPDEYGRAWPVAGTLPPAAAGGLARRRARRGSRTAAARACGRARASAGRTGRHAATLSARATRRPGGAPGIGATVPPTRRHREQKRRPNRPSRERSPGSLGGKNAPLVAACQAT